MSFNIFCSGVTIPRSGGKGHFNYIKKDCLEQGDFDPPALLSWIPSSPTPSGVAEKIAGSPESHLGGGMVKGMSKIAEMHCIHLIQTSIELLTLHAGGGQISVHCYQKNLIWSDTSSFVEFKLKRRGSPGKDFIKEICPGLKNTKLNNFGVLAQIAIALSKYEAVLPRTSPPFLSIQLKH